MDVTGLLGEHRYRLIAFDWDGTAVTSRAQKADELARAMAALLDQGVTLVIITGTNAKNVAGQIAPLLSPASLARLYMMVNRGSEVYAFDEEGRPERLWLREATAEEEQALDRTADAVRDELRSEYGVEIEIVRDRLNRRKLDLIPEPEWADPPKDRIGELLDAVQKRLEPVPGGIGAVIDMTARAATEAGLPDARITTDVKHVEVGLTDKSDSIAYLMRRLAPMRAILPAETLIAGDEFGPIGGFEGSDYRMVTRLAAGATLVSVGREPGGVPRGVMHVGGGPAAFLQLLEELARKGPPRAEAPPPPPPAAEPPPAGEGWVVVDDRYDPVSEASRETLFALANGYMGVRGSLDEGGPGTTPGAYVAGLYDGAEPGHEDLVVIPDWTHTRIDIDGTPLRPWEWRVLEHRRRIDLRTGRLERMLRWARDDGRVLRLRSTRLVSLADPHVAAGRLDLALEEGDPCRVRIEAGVHAGDSDGPLPRAELVAVGGIDGVDMAHARTPAGRVAVDTAVVVTAQSGDGPLEPERVVDERTCARAVESDLAPGEEIRVDRIVVVYTDRESDLPAVAARDRARAAAADGFEAIAAAHADAWAGAWEAADVEIDGDHSAQLGVRFAAAQLVAAAPPAGGRSSVGAKGLSGEGYHGHVFWDTDMFLMPFYAAVLPAAGRRIIDYRVLTLPAAERHAEDAGLEGAWFAWESAASGEDVTPDHVVGPGGRRLPVLTGSQEIHVVADVAWAIEWYVRTSGDDSVLAAGGAEVTAQAARFFASRAVETARGYEIRGVIGPDELHENVDNNAFTNLMAAWTLRRAADLADAGAATAAGGEPERWREVATRLVVDRTQDGLIEQHDGFMQLPVAPQERPGRDELAWQRDRMEWRDVKQADVVMLMAVREPDYSEDERRRHFELYEPLTRHLSSLSEAVHSLVARRAGLAEQADDYLRRALAIDLEDSRGNRAEGMHMATQGGIWQAVVLGCAGARSMEDGTLRLDPRLPAAWTRIRFRWNHRGALVDVTVRPGAVEVAAAAAVTVALPGATAEIGGGRSVRFEAAGDGWRVVA